MNESETERNFSRPEKRHSTQKTAGHNTWLKKLGLMTQITKLFILLGLFLSWDKEVAANSPTFPTTTTLWATVDEDGKD